MASLPSQMKFSLRRVAILFFGVLALFAAFAVCDFLVFWAAARQGGQNWCMPAPIKARTSNAAA
jgi:hypothetical protein